MHCQICKMKKIISLFNSYKWFFLLIVVLILLVVYKFFNPYDVNFYPKCLFYATTGYKCPGCGSQRAIHYLLNLDIKNALKENFLMVISIPYLIFGAITDFYRNKYNFFRTVNEKFYSNKAVWVVFLIIVIYWVVRNL